MHHALCLIGHIPQALVEFKLALGRLAEAPVAEIITAVYRLQDRRGEGNHEFIVRQALIRQFGCGKHHRRNGERRHKGKPRPRVRRRNKLLQQVHDTGLEEIKEQNSDDAQIQEYSGNNMARFQKLTHFDSSFSR